MRRMVSLATRDEEGGEGDSEGEGVGRARPIMYFSPVPLSFLLRIFWWTWGKGEKGALL